MSRTFHIDEVGNRVIATDHPSVRAHLLAKGFKLADGGRGARQYAMRHDSECLVVNANWRDGQES